MRRPASIYRSARLSAPASTPAQLNEARSGPLVVAGLFRTASGIGESARSCANAFEKHGFDVLRVDLSDSFRQTDMTGSAYLDKLPDEKHGTLVLHLNAPETTKALFDIGYRGAKTWRVVGYWVWELETLPRSWLPAARHLTEIWTPSQFSADAIGKSVDLPVNIAPHFVSPQHIAGDNPFRYSLPADAVVSLVMGDSRSSYDRKNLLGGVNAFLEGAGQNPNAWLIIKTRNFENQAAFNDALAEQIKSHPRIRLIDKAISETEKWQLIDACDIFLSLHRSEGFGLVIAEAMALGKAVIATAWSGNLEFMSPDAGSLVPYKLINTDDRAGVYVDTGNQQRWADPDRIAAAQMVVELTENAEQRRTLGERGRDAVKQKLDGSQYVRLLELHTPSA